MPKIRVQTLIFFSNQKLIYHDEQIKNVLNKFGFASNYWYGLTSKVVQIIYRYYTVSTICNYSQIY